MNRRDFFLRSAATAGVLALAKFPYAAFASATKKQASDRVKLGPRGIEVSRLAQGTGTNGSHGSSAQTRLLGQGGTADLLHAGYDNGITFWDSADQYGTHPDIKEALKAVPREKVVILTKTHSSTEKDMRADLDRYRKELGVDYIDVVLLHALQASDWPDANKGAMDVLEEAREKKIIRSHGTSCHSLAALTTAAAHPWAEIVFARINPAGRVMDGDPQTIIGVLKKMKAAGKGVVAMKVFGAGRLPGQEDKCLEFDLSLDCVDAMTIGALNRDQMLDLVKRIPAASVRG